MLVRTELGTFEFTAMARSFRCKTDSHEIDVWQASPKCKWTIMQLNGVYTGCGEADSINQAAHKAVSFLLNEVEE